MSRYLIGIDLGTTNSCVAYVDTFHPQAPIQPLPIPQLVAPGVVEPRPLLPSFCYLAAPGEWQEGALVLPWSQSRDYIVGALALTHGSRVPSRLVTAAKSWLCHSAASRRDPILPTSGDAAARISPVTATARYLSHIAEAWNFAIARGRGDDTLEQQEVILTVPASFDEVARALTAEAAKSAGYGAVTILEEPQAAFYCWIDAHETSWQRILTAGDTVLVCDVGGGTTDFSIISVKGEGSSLTLERMAVGDHLLLGGDNIDVAIAHYVAAKLEGGNELSSTQWLELCHQCRHAKEQLLGGGKESFRLTLRGSGSRVVEGSVTTLLTYDELLREVLQGFFGDYSWQESLNKTPSRGLRTMGLPYEDEPSIVKQLATFLATHGLGGEPVRPSHLLFNGGTLHPRPFQDALIASITRWFGRAPTPLTTPHFDSAVARGAAYYGKVRRGLGVTIGGGSPRSYYLAIQVKDSKGSTTMQAMTLLARGAEEGATYTAPHTFLLTPNTAVTFDLYTSHTRLYDKPGELIALDPTTLHRLPPIHTILRYGKQGSLEPIAVRLGLSLTAIGTLELWLASVDSTHRWSLAFQLRTVTGQEDTLKIVGEARRDVTYEASHSLAAVALITEAFTPGSGIIPKTLPERLEALLAMPRRQWSPSLLRTLWPPLLARAQQRCLSTAHAERWWHLAGWLLRPGYGYPLDDFRIKELWKVLLADLKSSKADEVVMQQLICIRRIAGGLTRGQQTQAVADSLSLLMAGRGSPLPQQVRRQRALYDERLRTVAAMEWLDVAVKTRLADALVARIAGADATNAELFALGRLAARHLVYAPLSSVIPSRQCAVWLERLIDATGSSEKEAWLPLIGQMARLTGHREIDIGESLRRRLLSHFVAGEEGDRERLHTLLTSVQPFTLQEQEQSLGDLLPPGLTLADH